MIEQYEIRVDLTINCSLCKRFHYTIYRYEGRRYGWVSTGISGMERTYNKAFEKGYKRFLKEIYRR